MSALAHMRAKVAASANITNNASSITGPTTNATTEPYSQLLRKAASRTTEFTKENLAKWSVIDGQDGHGLPEIEGIKSIHVYDFDNTLFKTPMPNTSLWDKESISLLKRPDAFINGGWWHDDRILAATGDGLAVEEARGWEGWWNESVVELVRLSMAQNDALTILLTGRGERKFSSLIQKMVNSKGLKFDMICLKPAHGPGGEQVKETGQYKSILLLDILRTYKNVEEFKIYEDRIHHCTLFDDLLQEYSRVLQAQGKPFKSDVVEVVEEMRILDPAKEAAEVEALIEESNRMISEQQMNGHRYRIKKTVYFTGYILDPKERNSLLSSISLPCLSEPDVKPLAKGIVISRHHGTDTAPPTSGLENAGGLNNTIEFDACSLGNYDNKVWAAWVCTVDPTIQPLCDGPETVIVLAVRDGAKPEDAKYINHWDGIVGNPNAGVDTEGRIQQVEGSQGTIRVRFKTTLGQLASLKIAEDGPYKKWHNFNGNSNHRGGYNRGGYYNNRNNYTPNHSNSNNNNNNNNNNGGGNTGRYNPRSSPSDTSGGWRGGDDRDGDFRKTGTQGSQSGRRESWDNRERDRDRDYRETRERERDREREQYHRRGNNQKRGHGKGRGRGNRGNRGNRGGQGGYGNRGGSGGVGYEQRDY